jgi:hypothetical protein
MSDNPPQSASPTLDINNDREVIVTFNFGQGWQILSPDGVSGFPAGGGLLPPGEGALKISIAPLDLQSLDAAAAQAAISKRVTDLAHIAEALALAQLQFATLLAQYKTP